MTKHILDSFAECASTNAVIDFLDLDEHITVADLWRQSAHAGSWIIERCQGAPVAMLMDTSPAGIAALLGALRCGIRVVSLPLPPRGPDVLWYADYLLETCTAADVSLVVVDASYAELIPKDLGFAVGTYQEADGHPRRNVPDATSGELVQFTSGSTSRPKGVVLTLDEVSANVETILAVLEPRPGDVCVSWLPLSHDMGLIGMLFAPLAAGRPGYVNGGRLGLMKPESFIRRPDRWLKACSELHATITAAPDFAFHLAAEVARGSAAVDLSSLRVCITGGEQIRADTLRAFAATFEAAGFDSLAFCPAYGLAEAALAVTLVPPESHWSSLLTDDVLTPAVPDSPATELVGSGPRLPGYEARIDGDRTYGRVLIAGPSVSRRYLGENPRNGPFQTEDLGFYVDDELYVVGRLDDVAIVAGRNLALADVDCAASSTGLVKPGRAVSAYQPELGLVVAVELSVSGDAQAAARDVSRTVAARTGVRPKVVSVVAPRTVPRTSSGKPRRTVVADGIANRTLDEICRIE